MVEVGSIKTNVIVGDGVSVDVPVGIGVKVAVWVEGGLRMAVCVCAAAAVPAMMVSIGRDSGPDGAGAERAGISQASRKSNAANKRISFLAICLSMLSTKNYLTSMMNLTVQKSVLPTLSDQRVE